MGFEFIDKDVVRYNSVHSRVVILRAGDGCDQWFESRDGGIGMHRMTRIA